MKINHGLGTGSLMQSIDILGDDLPDTTHGLRQRESLVPEIWAGIGDATPANIASGPVSNPGFVRTHEDVIGHRMPRHSSLSAVIGNSRVGAEAGSGQRNNLFASEHLASHVN